MLRRRDFLKGMIMAGAGFGNGFFATSGIYHLTDLSDRDNSIPAHANDEPDYSPLMEGCTLTTLTRVIKTHRAEIPVWAIEEKSYDWLEIHAYCLGLDRLRNLFPLSIMFLGSDLIESQEKRVQTTMAKAKGQEARNIIEQIKDNVLRDLKKDAIIVANGSLLMEATSYMLMNPRYQLLPAKSSRKELDALFTDSRRLNKLKEEILRYSWCDNFFPCA